MKPDRRWVIHTEQVRPLEVSPATGTRRVAERVVQRVPLQMLRSGKPFTATLVSAGESLWCRGVGIVARGSFPLFGLHPDHLSGQLNAS